MSATATERADGMRIGEVAELAGTTPRTVRYYEELGLLRRAERGRGQHRLYSDGDVERLRELIRVKELLGVSLEELRDLVDAEEARAVLRQEYRRGAPLQRRREILSEAIGHLDRQLELVRRRSGELDALRGELEAKRERLRGRLAELPAGRRAASR